MPRPRETPIGLQLSRTARDVGRAFDDVLRAAGGSTPTWLILISIKSHGASSQRELAEAVGIRGATLTHHLDGMERDGLIRRRRDPDNRRVQHVEITAAGEKTFVRLRAAATAHDARLRRNLSAADVAELRRLLEVLGQNVEP